MKENTKVIFEDKRESSQHPQVYEHDPYDTGDSHDRSQIPDVDEELNRIPQNYRQQQEQLQRSEENNRQ